MEKKQTKHIKQLIADSRYFVKKILWRKNWRRIWEIKNTTPQ